MKTVVPQSESQSPTSRHEDAVGDELPAVTPEQCRMMRTECMMFHLRRAERVVTEFYNRMLEESGISAAQMPVLAALRIHGAMTLVALSRIVDLDPSTLSRNLALLAKRKLVMMPSGKDRRMRNVDLTREGHRALAVAYPRWREAQSEVAALLGPTQPDAMAAVRSLSRLRSKTADDRSV